MLEQLLKRDFVFLDNANGWILLKRGLKPGQRPDIMNITAPDIVEDLQRRASEAGSDIVCTNTFGANARTLRGTGYTVGEIVCAAVAVTKRACAGRALTALDIGPIGEFITPFGPLTFDESYELYKEQATAAEEAGADLAAIETMSDLMELKAAMLAVKENTKLPILAMMTFDKSGRTFTGCRPESFAVTAEALGAAAAGINCSLAPAEIYPIAEKIAGATGLPLIIKPNAGLPSSETGQYDIGPAAFAGQMARFAGLGVKLVGGCCGTTADYIAELYRTFKHLTPAARKQEPGRRICTPLQIESVEGYTYIVDGGTPNTPEEIAEDALEQADRGERILRVRLPGGLSEEKAAGVVRGIQSQSDKPLHLISAELKTLESALRSVSGVAAASCGGCGARELADAAAKYGAVVI